MSPGPPPAFPVHEIDRAQAPAIAAVMGPEGDLVATRLARGVRCFAVRVEDAIAGYGWLSVGPEWIGEIQLEIRPRHGEGYVWNCFTMPEFRRQGVFRSLLLGISGHARSSGLRRLWIGSVAIPAEKAVGPAGFKPAIYSTIRSLAGWHIAVVRGSGDRSLASEARVVLGSAARIRAWRSHPRRH